MAHSAWLGNVGQHARQEYSVRKGLYMQTLSYLVVGTEVIDDLTGEKAKIIGLCFRQGVVAAD